MRWLCSWLVVFFLVVLIHSCLGLCSWFVHARAGQGASPVWGADQAGGEALHAVGAGAGMVCVMGITFNPHPLHLYLQGQCGSFIGWIIAACGHLLVRTHQFVGFGLLRIATKQFKFLFYCFPPSPLLKIPWLPLYGWLICQVINDFHLTHWWD